jgi:hypothetical protein
VRPGVKGLAAPAPSKDLLRKLIFDQNDAGARTPIGAYVRADVDERGNGH